MAGRTGFGFGLLRFLWVSLLVLQLLPLGYYLSKEETLRQLNEDAAPPLTDQAVIDYLLKKGMGNAAVELTQLLQQQQMGTTRTIGKKEQTGTSNDIPVATLSAKDRLSTQEGAHVVYFDYNTTISNNDCQLNPDTISWIGAGVDGPVFLGNFECANNPQLQQQWALKLVAPRQNKTYGVIRSMGQEKQNKLEDIYNRIVGANPLTAQERQNVLDHFAVAVGTVRVPYNTVAGKLRDLVSKNQRVRYDMAKTDNPQEDTITAAVMPVVKGQVLGKIYAPQREEHLFTINERRQIVRDLIFIFKQMFDTNFFHCDIWPRHFMLSSQTNKVIIMDFDRTWLLLRPQREGADTIRQRQFLQMLSFIGMACNNSPKDSFEKIEHESHICGDGNFKEWPDWAMPQPVVNGLNPFLDKCSNLFPGHLQFEAAELDNVAEAFDKLQRWVNSS